MPTLSPDSPLPDYLTTQTITRTGEPLLIRPLQAEDAERLGVYFAGLSPESRSRYGPHAFDQETADAICANLEPHAMLRFVGVLSSEAEGDFVAYVLLRDGVLKGDSERYEKLGIPLHPETDCTLAPSVRDGYQNRGVGSLMMNHVLDSAKRLGYRRVVLWGGVQSTNLRAVHLYQKFGFVKVGEFYNGKDNDDMILDLSSRKVTP